MPWDDLQLAQPGAYTDGHRAYSLSKLLMAMFSMELVRFTALVPVFLPPLSLLKPTATLPTHSKPQTPQAAKHGSTDLPVVCCDPGTVNTKMLEAGWGMYGIDLSVANDETFLATDPKMEGANGKYFVSRRDTQANPEAYNVEERQRLWRVLEEICGIQY